jgi:SAM-dependent methyltransferase
MSERDYVLGTHDDEISRLGLQHRCWRAQAHALWERAGLRAGSRVVDLGCGPGWATLDLAPLVAPGGSVVAVDRSRRFLDHLEAALRHGGITNVEVVESDAEALALPEASVDAVYTRWLFSFVERPERVLAAVARALRPGGVLLAQEYVSYAAMKLAPRTASLDRVVRAIYESWRARGGENDIGLVLPGLAAKAGLVTRELTPIARLARPGTSLWSWPESFFKNFVPTLVEKGLLTAAEKAAFDEEWARASRDPDAFFFCPVVLDYVGVKAENKPHASH